VFASGGVIVAVSSTKMGTNKVLEKLEITFPKEFPTCFFKCTIDSNNTVWETQFG